jgi:hypothetical protein
MRVELVKTNGINRIMMFKLFLPRLSQQREVEVFWVKSVLPLRKTPSLLPVWTRVVAHSVKKHWTFIVRQESALTKWFSQGAASRPCVMCSSVEVETSH